MISMIKQEYSSAVNLNNSSATTTAETTASTQNLVQNQADFSVSVLMADGNVEILELDTYITGVLLREMPMEFELEALKAQAVVARTYTLRRYNTGGKHANAIVCTDSACCQGYSTREEYLARGEDESSIDKARRAVEETKGKVIMYNGQLAEATYFSCSGGMTEDAQAVWGAEIPYLTAVESPGEEDATHYTDTIVMSDSDFAKKLGINQNEISNDWIGEIDYTEGGGVNSIEISGKIYKGTDVRNLLSLRSTAFTITILGNSVSITTKGYGHRVGMSQYGADAMAVSGSDYKEIISHYYVGTELVDYAF